MDDTNGNGHFEPIEIDVTNDVAFRTGVVKYLQKISDETKALPGLKRKVEKHDRIVQYGTWTAVPFVALVSMIVKHLLSKVGL